MKRIWSSALLLSLLGVACAKGKPVPWTSVASSGDGTRLVAVGGGYIHTSTDSGATWTQRGPWAYWTSVASSADGTKLVAANKDDGYGDRGDIFVSTDSGVSWRQTYYNETWGSVASSSDGSKLVAFGRFSFSTSSDSGVSWAWSQLQTGNVGSQTLVASSADGTKLVAVETDGYIYTSANAGAYWAQTGWSDAWTSVASSADGRKLVAVAKGSSVYTSTNSGATWTQAGQSNNWASVASSADGSNLVAAAAGGSLYISTDSGANWTQTGVSDDWASVASSADGSKLVAITSAGHIYTSANFGTTWTTAGGAIVGGGGSTGGTGGTGGIGGTGGVASSLTGGAGVGGTTSGTGGNTSTSTGGATACSLSTGVVDGCLAVPNPAVFAITDTCSIGFWAKDAASSGGFYASRCTGINGSPSCTLTLACSAASNSVHIGGAYLGSGSSMGGGGFGIYLDAGVGCPKMDITSFTGLTFDIDATTVPNNTVIVGLTLGDGNGAEMNIPTATEPQSVRIRFASLTKKNACGTVTGSGATGIYFGFPWFDDGASHPVDVTFSNIGFY